MKERIVVAMSGGVDSSVAAALLKDKDYEVIGITMCFNLVDSGRKKPACCGAQGIEDARRVAHKLDIKHYVLNMQKPLYEYVVKDFLREYTSGRTPNPCVRCNQFLKFDRLLKKALSLDAKYLATGHYAKIIKTRSGYRLEKAKDSKKDQSYFLYRLNQNQLKHTLFPLGNYTKEEVRELAMRFGLSVANKAGSQEICFLPELNYSSFLDKQLKDKVRRGVVTDLKGNILGTHRGIAHYTIGQRQGLGVAQGYPIYVTKIEPKKNRIIVGTKEEVMKKEFWVKEPHFLIRRLKKKVVLNVRIRYNHQGAPAQVLPLGNKIKVRFRSPQFAITPGQSAVFYQKRTVIGGGIIDKVTG